VPPIRVAIVSDIHYASAAEAARRDHVFAPITNPFRRWIVRQYRHWLWMRDPFAHNHLLEQFCSGASAADLVVGNGDYSCDSAYIGVSDDAAFASARDCLDRLRQTFGGKFRAVIGDHEIGKKMLAADQGGLRLASYRRTLDELQLEPLWKVQLGRYLLLGITSTLVALPVYEAEALPEERSIWRQLRAEHLDAIGATFASIRPRQRILLFCHDPTALPFLARHPDVLTKLGQIERTIIGHLHSELIFRTSRLLAGLPRLRGLGHTVLRNSCALQEARHWKGFKPLLCPSISGIQLLKDGGYYTLELDPDGGEPGKFERHSINW
jgi:3',5'-cyclic AMP phosphodiesterase CpdA